MYNSQEIAERIKQRANQQNISVNQVLSKCKLGKNTVAKMASGTDILTQNFAKIADYLDCSVDYLLGRTDNPEINRSILQEPTLADYGKIAAEDIEFTRPGKKPKTTLYDD